MFDAGKRDKITWTRGFCVSSGSDMNSSTDSDPELSWNLFQSVLISRLKILTNDTAVSYSLYQAMVTGFNVLLVSLRNKSRIQKPFKMADLFSLVVKRIV